MKALHETFSERPEGHRSIGDPLMHVYTHDRTTPCHFYAGPEFWGFRSSGPSTRPAPPAILTFCFCFLTLFEEDQGLKSLWSGLVISLVFCQLPWFPW